jgi:DNA-binding transcriptional LysR family regulator
MFMTTAEQHSPGSWQRLRDLEVRHLIALDAVSSEGTFGRAAEKLGYTQSAISQQIAALEKVVGGKLFDRPGGPRPVEITPLGSEVLDVARDLLGRVESAGHRIDRFRSGEIGQITVGTFQSTSAAVLPLVVRQRAFGHVASKVAALWQDDNQGNTAPVVRAA